MYAHYLARTAPKPKQLLKEANRRKAERRMEQYKWERASG